MTTRLTQPDHIGNLGDIKVFPGGTIELEGLMEDPDSLLEGLIQGSIELPDITITPNWKTTDDFNFDQYKRDEMLGSYSISPLARPVGSQILKLLLINKKSKTDYSCDISHLDWPYTLDKFNRLLDSPSTTNLENTLYALSYVFSGLKGSFDSLRNSFQEYYSATSKDQIKGFYNKITGMFWDKINTLDELGTILYFDTIVGAFNYAYTGEEKDFELEVEWLLVLTTLPMSINSRDRILACMANSSYFISNIRNGIEHGNLSTEIIEHIVKILAPHETMTSSIPYLSKVSRKN